MYGYFPCMCVYTPCWLKQRSHSIAQACMELSLWPQAHNSPPATALQVLELQVSVTISHYYFNDMAFLLKVGVFVALFSL